jgi:putative endonuclease
MPQLGSIGEDIAADYLASNGYRIVGRNVRTRFGELDIVATRGRTVVFVEVKTRASDRCGSPFESVDERKQMRLRALAMSFLQERGWRGRPCRFDVIAVRCRDGPPQVRHLEAAF